MSGRRKTRCALVLVLLLGAACSSKPKAGSTPTPSPRPSSTAQLAIASPRNGETVKGPNVKLVLTLAGGTIVPLTTTNLKPDEGHLHVKLDNVLLSQTAGTTLDIPDVKPGSHVVLVEFVASDHAPFEPRVFVAVTFRVT